MRRDSFESIVRPSRQCLPGVPATSVPRHPRQPSQRLALLGILLAGACGGSGRSGLGAVLTATIPIAATAQHRGCFPPEHAQSLMIYGKVKRTLTDARAAPVRTARSLRRLPTDSIILVTDSTLCTRARKAIATFRRDETGGGRVVLVRIGERYWAEDPTLRGGEFADVYLLEGELTRVLHQ